MIKRRYRRLSDSQWEAALKRCRNGESVRKVAADFQIHRDTLYRKLKKASSLARKIKIFSEEEENRLKNWILDRARLGLPTYSNDLEIAATKILHEAGRESLYGYKGPGNRWMKSFFKRHPEIIEEQTELISKSLGRVTEENLKTWFSEVKSSLEANDVISVLERPESIFNGGESVIQLCPKNGYLLREDKNETSWGKETVTVLCSFSAAGASLPPMIIFSCEQIPEYLSKSVPADWSIGRSGCMVPSTFYEYMANVFYPWCVKRNVQFPVIYFLDGNKAELSLELSDFCAKGNIILVSLLPSAAHIIHPSKVAIFRHMNNNFKEEVNFCCKKGTQVPITKETFVSLFKKAFGMLSVNIIKNGFRKCGLYPFNPNAINYDRIEESLHHSDLISAKRFFDCLIDEELIKEFIEIRNNNESSNDGVYLLWKICMDNLESAELEEN